MKANKIIAVGALAGITALAPHTWGQQAEAQVDINTSQARGETELRTDRDADVDVDVDTDKTTRDQAKAMQDRVLPSNKASGLIGMEVKNPQGEKLGDIKDLVLDLKSGKISYAVLGVGGFLGLGEKLMAVPADAFQVNQQDGTLTLNADKAKIEAAPGFAATNWPRVDDPNLEARTFWMGDEATGAPAGTQTDRKIETEVKTDRDTKIYTDADEKKDGKKLEGEVDVDID